MRTVLYLMFLGFSISIYAQQRGEQSLTQLQESPAGSKILWFIDEVKSGDLSQESMDKYFSPKLLEKIGTDRLKAAFNDILENDGSLTLYKAERIKLTEYKLVVKGSKSEGWLEMKFYFEDNDPYRISGFTTDTVDNGNDSLKPIYPKTK